MIEVRAGLLSGQMVEVEVQLLCHHVVVLEELFDLEKSTNVLLFRSHAIHLEAQEEHVGPLIVVARAVEQYNHQARPAPMAFEA